MVGLRQNLGMLVDGGAPTPAAANPGNWGGSVAGVATMRSGLGVDAHGALLWAGGRLSPLDLANALVAGGAVRAMEMDINPEWVTANLYSQGPDGKCHGVKGLEGSQDKGGMRAPADRYLSTDTRDFVAVYSKP